MFHGGRFSGKSASSGREISGVAAFCPGIPNEPKALAAWAYLRLDPTTPAVHIIHLVESCLTRTIFIDLFSAAHRSSFFFSGPPNHFPHDIKIWMGSNPNRPLSVSCNRACYPPKVKHGTWKWHPGIGDSFWKTIIFGSMFNLGRVDSRYSGFFGVKTQWVESDWDGDFDLDQGMMLSTWILMARWLLSWMQPFRRSEMDTFFRVFFLLLLGAGLAWGISDFSRKWT